MGHKVTLRQPDGETETLARYPDHDDATAHLDAYTLWSDEEWTVAEDYRTAETADGRQLTVTPAPVHASYEAGNAATDPRHGVLCWDNEVTTEVGLSLVLCEKSQPDALQREITGGSVGIVLSGLDQYLDEHQRKVVETPKYYSRFPDDPEEPLAEGPAYKDSREASTFLAGYHIEVAIRVLTGGGRYPASEFTVYDCLPRPCVVSRDDDGAVALAPGIVPFQDGGDDDD